MRAIFSKDEIQSKKVDKGLHYTLNNHDFGVQCVQKVVDVSDQAQLIDLFMTLRKWANEMDAQVDVSNQEELYVRTKTG